MKWATILISFTAALQFGVGDAQRGRLSGRKTSATGSSVKCVARASSRSASYSKEAFTSLGAEIAAELCSATASEAEITISVEKVARAFAFAVAETSVGCTAVGNAKGSASASAKAEAQAETTAEALLDGWASVETCNGCKAAAELYLTSFERVLAHAVAESKSEVEVNAEHSGKDRAEQNNLVKKVVDLVLPVKSELTTTVRTAIEDGEETCTVVVKGCTVAGSDGGCCDLTAENTAKAIEVDAIAEAGAGAEAVAAKCSAGDELAAYAQTTATAMARAYAEAVVKVDAHCETTENSSACVWAEVSQDKMAKAQAEAFAAAWVKANSGCKCQVELLAVADALERIYASATAEVFLEVCSEGDGMAGIEAVAKAYEDKTVEAVASALAIAIVEGDECGAVVSSCAATGGNYACCDLLVDNTAETFEDDAMAEIVAEAELFTCDFDGSPAGDGSATAHDVGEAIATAWAKVLTDINVYCDSNGDASACGLAESSISAAARAQAKAIATAWAKTVDDCGCELKLEATVESIASVLVEVTLHVHRNICVAGGEVYSEENVLALIGEAQITAIAEAMATISQENKVCEAEIEVETKIE